METFVVNITDAFLLNIFIHFFILHTPFHKYISTHELVYKGPSEQLAVTLEDWPSVSIVKLGPGKLWPYT